MLLETIQLTKSFDGNPVLKGISLTLESGCILGLVGENGAGKSTLIKCLTGIHKQDSGVIHWEGAVSCIPQEFNLINDLTVAENIFLGREPSRFGRIRYSEMNRSAENILQKLHAEIRPDVLVGTLGAAKKQMVEIAKALSVQSRLLIMDEPTTVLNRTEAEILFGIMRTFKESGGSVLFVSHKLEEVREICDEVAVLRDGILVARDAAKNLSAKEIAEKMVGRELNRMFPPKLIPHREEFLLEANGLSDGKTVREASFRLRKGAVTGLAGLAGAGRTELAEMLCGIRHPKKGRIIFNGETLSLRRSPADALKQGIAYLSEDRQGSGILTEFPLSSNITLSSLRKYCRFGVISKRRENDCVRQYISDFQIKTSSGTTELKFLSGGNQQKAAIAKGLDTDPKIYVFDEPTRGVDIGARSEIYSLIRNLAEQGMACLLISSDLEEILGMCDQVMVMRNGAITGTLSGEKLNEKEIMYLATGVSSC